MPEVDARRILEAAQRLEQGRLVAFPTETVYGLGADAENPQAVAHLYAIKGRPASHPVIVHLSPETDPAYWAGHLSPVAQRLISAFWPGPLTLILPRAAHIPDVVSGGQDSIGLRCPSHPVAQMLLHAFAGLKPHGQGGVAAPSANLFGHVSPTRAAHVRREFPTLDEQALMILDGGEAEVGIESTILDVSRLESGRPPVLLRPGQIGTVQLADILGEPPASPDAGAPRASGSLKAHYAPRTPLQIQSRVALQGWLDARRGHAAARAATAHPGPEAHVPRVAIIGLGPAPGPLPPGVQWVALPADPAVYAHRLYALLRELDEAGLQQILLQELPDEALWQGVNDRITRAAAAFS
ncbi:L-threonylcarbamoyladenylate synthase [Castellaniella sp.]|uniref:L-threonylcarbamoyladenylate synthase n=1 Tax=Castellaniella sp. TaxID=1955812 RepID=UPI00355D25A1